jgi:uncharacterized protein
MPTRRPFLTAEWRYLLILNYEVEASVLEPLVPAGTHLDLWQGKVLVSAVGFMFLNTRVMGAKVPLHTNFEEVNLRFYVCRDTQEETRRGVAFIKEVVPRPAIAGLARVLYGEKYISLPMKHTIETDRRTGRLSKEGLVEYAWQFNGKLNRLGALAMGDPQPLAAGSEAEFILEHYWGYTRLNERQTGEYRVEHPAWNIWPVAQPYLLCNVRAIYGEAFEPFLHHRPRSAFLAEGSPVGVYPGKKINHGAEGT